MKVKQDELEFEWDEGNIEKSRLKHGITSEEAESVFEDEKAVVLPDIEHSQIEERLIIVGRNFEKERMHIVFTMRKDRVRVISARKTHKKEVLRYEKIKKDTTL